MAKCRGEVVYQNQGSRTADCAAFDDQALIHSYEQAVHSFMEALEKDRVPPECRSSNESESEEEEEEEEEEEGRQWQIGDACLAVWSGDGLLYPACISAMDLDQGCCVVRFNGYGDEEEHPLSALLPPDWRSPDAEDAVMEWSVGDPCQAVWSGDGLLYPAAIVELDAVAGTCWVEFDHYGNQEQQALVDLLPPMGYREESSDASPFPKGRSSEEKDQANASIPPSQKDKKAPPLPPLHSHEDEEALICMLLAWHLSGYYTGYYVGFRQGRKKVAVPAPKKGLPQHLRVSEHR